MRLTSDQAFQFLKSSVELNYHKDVFDKGLVGDIAKLQAKKVNFIGYQ